MKILVLLALLVGCTTNDHEPTRAPAPQTKSQGKNIVDDEVKRALILDAAIKKLEAEIADLEASPTPDNALLAEKKDALAALRSTLTRIQRRIGNVNGSRANPD